MVIGRFWKNVYFCNNTNYNVFRTSSAPTTDIYIKTAPVNVIWEGTTPATTEAELKHQRYVLNSTTTINSNNAMHFRVNVETDTTSVNVRLYTIINEFKNVSGALDNNLRITWYSNLDVTRTEVSGVTEYYEIAVSNIKRGHFLLDITIVPDLTTISYPPYVQEAAVGWCNVIMSGDDNSW